tara:strand:+ start:2738 stop:3268 length:531 start_codon:yes stop_codon:yes gene_type:complete
MNYTILFVNTIFGLLLVYSYYFSINKLEKPQRLWGRIHEKYRPVYTVSMLLAALGYMLMMYFLVVKVKNNNELLREILVLQIIVILASMLWMPLATKYIKNKNEDKNKNKNIILKFAIILILFTVAIASIGNFFKVLSINFPQKDINVRFFSVIGAFYLFFHTFALDFLSWNYNFF